MLSDVADLFEGAPVAPPKDRRLTRRVVDAWARAARGRFPSWTALQDQELGADIDWMFVVDCEKSCGFPFFVFLGEQLSKFSDVFLTGGENFGLSLLDKATADIYAAQASEAPHFREESLVLCDGRRVLIRAVTAPLAEDGRRITHIVGAVNGRFAHDAEAGSDLRLA